LEFATANQLEAVPLEAEVLAVCDGAMTIRQSDSSFGSLTDEEQAALDELVADSQVTETTAATTNRKERSLRGLLRDLLSF